MSCRIFSGCLFLNFVPFQVLGNSNRTLNSRDILSSSSKRFYKIYSFLFVFLSKVFSLGNQFTPELLTKQRIVTLIPENYKREILNKIYPDSTQYKPCTVVIRLQVKFLTFYRIFPAQFYGNFLCN